MKKLFTERYKFGGIFVILFASLSLLMSGCGKKESEDISFDAPPSRTVSASVNLDVEDDFVMDNRIAAANTKRPKSYKTTRQAIDEANAELEENFGKMVTYEVSYMGRINPFMPYGEEMEYKNARSSAISEANAKNKEIFRIKKLQNVSVREADDISPYSFNLPVPPTSPGPSNSAVARITKTKVVGIMYNDKSPSAIINVDNKDYLVRPGDKIIGQEYIVTKINPTWVTAAMGSNVYSAAIGELFSKDGINENQTDIYDLKNRFGGRKI